MDDRNNLQRLQQHALALPSFDRLVMQLRWADAFSRAETALVLEVESASVLAAEIRLHTWLISECLSHSAQLV